MKKPTLKNVVGLMLTLNPKGYPYKQNFSVTDIREQIKLKEYYQVLSKLEDGDLKPFEDWKKRNPKAYVLDDKGKKRYLCTDTNFLTNLFKRANDFQHGPIGVC